MKDTSTTKAPQQQLPLEELLSRDLEAWLAAKAAIDKARKA